MNYFKQSIRSLQNSPRYSTFYTHPLNIPVRLDITTPHPLDPIWAESVNLRHIYAFRQAVTDTAARVAIVGDVINSDVAYVTQLIQLFKERNPDCHISEHNESIGEETWGDMDAGFGPVLATISDSQDSPAADFNLIDVMMASFFGEIK